MEIISSTCCSMGDGGEDSGPSICGRCSKEIEGKAMKAKDTLYCEETCFSCVECGADLRQTAVYAKESQLYCEKCYKAKFVPKCGKCCEYITEVNNNSNNDKGLRAAWVGALRRCPGG